MSLHLDPDRIPVYSAYGMMIEKATAMRVREYMFAPNAQIVWRRDGRVARIYLREFEADSRERSKQRGRKFSHNHETRTNIERVWTHDDELLRAAAT